MKIKALAPWFGGKRTLAPRIAAELGKHTQFFDPAAASLAVLFAKEPSQKETVGDLHGDITNLARVIACPSMGEQLYDRLCRVVMSEGLLEDARENLEFHSIDAVLEECAGSPGAVSPLMLERAYWYFLASWMGRNGTAGTERLDYQIAVRWTKNGGSPTMRFRHAVESMPAWHRRLQNVVVLRRDMFEYLHKFEDHESTAVYLDPPYPPEVRTGFEPAASGGGKYLHEFNHGGPDGAVGLFEAGPDDHARAAAVLREYKHARIVVSTYDCPRYRALYEGWTFVDCAMNKSLHNQNGRGPRVQEAPEVLVINGPSYTGDWKS